MASASVDITGLFDPLLTFDSELTAELEADSTSIPLDPTGIAILCAQNWCFPVEFVLCYRTVMTEIVKFTGCVDGAPVFERAEESQKFPAGSRLAFSFTENNCTIASNAAAGLVTGRVQQNVTDNDVVINFGDDSLCANILAGKRATIKMGTEIIEAYGCVDGSLVVIRGASNTAAIGHPIGTCWEVTALTDENITEVPAKADSENTCACVVSPDCILLELDDKGLDLGSGSLTSVLQSLICIAANNGTGAGGGTPSNNPPVAPPNQIIECEPSTPLNFTVPAAFDPDGDVLTLTHTAPAGVTVTLQSDNTVLIGGLCPNIGIYDFSMTYTDPSGASASSAVRILSTFIVGAGPNSTGFVDQELERNTFGSYDFAGCFSHPDNLPLSYTLTSSLPTGMTFNSATGNVSGSPSVAGTYAIVVRATDTNGLTADCALNLSVVFTPAAPVVINQPGIITFQQGRLIFYDASECFQSPDGLTLTYAVIGVDPLPTGLQLNPITGAITGGVDNAPVLPGMFTVRATDTQGQSVDCIFNYQVAPQFIPIFFAKPENTTGSVGQVSTFLFNNCFALPSGVTPTYAVVGSPPPGMTLTANGELTGTPTTPGTYTVTVNVTAGGVTEQCTKTITLLAAVATTGTISDQVDVLGNPIVLDLSTCFTSPNNLTFSATGLPTGLSIDPDEGLISGIVSAEGVFNITVTATDFAGNTAQCTYQQTVNAIDVSAPSNSGFGDQNFIVGDAVNLDIGGSFSDPDGDALAFTIAPSSPPGMTLSSLTGLLSGTASVAGTYPLTVTATDPDGNSSQLTFTITVT